MYLGVRASRTNFGLQPNISFVWHRITFHLDDLKVHLITIKTYVIRRTTDGAAVRRAKRCTFVVPKVSQGCQQEACRMSKLHITPLVIKLIKDIGHETEFHRICTGRIPQEPRARQEGLCNDRVSHPQGPSAIGDLRGSRHHQYFEMILNVRTPPLALHVSSKQVPGKDWTMFQQLSRGDAHVI